ncbi:RagB/SusD family nutrient uptake outer membrane protein [Wenyingzhuangia sp. IMCC45574]
MKLYKIYLLAILSVCIIGCSDLEEEAPFLANTNVYSSGEGAKGAVNGMYAGMIAWAYYGNQFMALEYLHSGFGVTRRGGNRPTSIDNATLASLKAEQNTVHVTRCWRGIYQVIGRTNDAIASAVPTDNPTTQDELMINDAIGQAYFLRAFNYFNLVRLWGEVPLRTIPSTQETLHLAKSSIAEINAQIIADLQQAQKYMNGSIGDGTPKVFAADMLLAKIYMSLATAPDANKPDPTITEAAYWQMAYDEAIKVYGEYSLMPNYADLFTGNSGNNSSESILELKSSAVASLDHNRAYTPNWFSQINTFGFFYANVSVFERHRTAYPSDPRLDITYLSTYTTTNNGNTFNSYPVNTTRSRFAIAFPFIFKLGTKDVNNSVRETTKGFRIFRYADLLLMLAEISNELENGEQLGYVTEVLNRVGLTPRPEYSQGKDAFRDAVMREYEFELISEGQDSFNHRRRGYDYFLNNVILAHNDNPLFKDGVDVTLETAENKVMYLPMSLDEINTNNLVSE